MNRTMVANTTAALCCDWPSALYHGVCRLGASSSLSHGRMADVSDRSDQAPPFRHCQSTSIVLALLRWSLPLLRPYPYPAGWPSLDHGSALRWHCSLRGNSTTAPTHAARGKSYPGLPRRPLTRYFPGIYLCSWFMTSKAIFCSTARERLHWVGN